MQTIAQHRRLPLEGAINVRDIGGYPTADGRITRWGTVLRADSLHRLTGDDRALLLDGYGIRSIVDLRRSSERAFAPGVFADSGDLTYRRLPIFEDAVEPGPAEPRSLDAVYRAILDTRKEQLALVFRSLLEADGLPVVIHCTAGKDRTGIVIALLLALAGVDDTRIAADYAMTAEFLTPDYYDGARERAERAGYRWEDYQKLLVCPPGLMLETLAYLHETYGSAPNFLSECGLSSSEIGALREALLEPASL